VATVCRHFSLSFLLSTPGRHAVSQLADGHRRSLVQEIWRERVVVKRFSISVREDIKKRHGQARGGAGTPQHDSLSVWHAKLWDRPPARDKGRGRPG